MDAAKYKHLVLGLIFVKYISDTFANTVAAWRGEDCHSVEGRNPGISPAPYADIPGFCRSVPLAEIAQHGHVLIPVRYVGAKEVEDNDEDFAPKMQQLTEKLGEQMAKGAALDQLIRQKLGGLTKLSSPGLPSPSTSMQVFFHTCDFH